MNVCAAPKSRVFQTFGQKRVSILAILISSRVWFLSALCIELGMFLRRRATFSSLSIRPSTIAVHDVFDIAMNQGTYHKAGLQQGIDLVKLQISGKVRISGSGQHTPI